ncbi:MAG: NADH-ubiquinone oxidoreductase-F iron-sulfur binding region domain-containing protein [Bacteroidales bacterium]|jgi:NADH:ubiquinone oxidoreductase subunit F (NADH-binding)/Pyruvate/2-oxoacid:ferredoxin oxidoreductase delta subunit/(2Fe-2S) ferredoxin|nr:NADH-ubiquinone oxidoreductase-F iron-sulfur binding region domain-containing protein [Bacteroidales bacterium]NLM91339.1 4Fe-4S binding protein [Bacteroidales bacterium]
MKARSPQAIKQFLINQVLLDPRRSENPLLEKELSYISRERVSKPRIYVGMGTCGKIAGAGQTFLTIKEYLDDHGIEADLVEGGCIGLCSAEPMVDVQLPGRARVSFGNISRDEVQYLLDEVLNHNLPDLKIIGQYSNDISQPWDGIPSVFEHPFFVNQKRILLDNCGLIDPVSVEEYIARGGYWAFTDSISKLTPAGVCELIVESELFGRGGGGYSTGKKWADTQKTISDQKFLVCNAVESDPGSYMNRVIIESNPHRLIEAVLLAAYAIGATKTFVFIRQEFKLAIERLEKAIENARNFGLLGHHIFDSGVNIDIIIKKGARAFVCGEETALNNSIEGKRAMPESKPPYPSEKGLWNKPTIVNNVETLFNVPLILKNGPDWFKNTGTSVSKGTKLFSLTGKVRNYGTIEVPMGVSFRDIIWRIGGGIAANKKFKAIILGINSGNYITESTLDTRIDFQELKSIGTSLGSGGFVVIDNTTCMVDLAKYFTDFFKKESCGKCIPCREGTARLLEIMEVVTQRPGKFSNFQTLERFKGVMQLRSLANVMKDTSLCALGKSAPNAILNTLNNFKGEFDVHIFERKCPANVCRDLRVFSIDVDLCTGCTACYKKCPADAIIGSARHPHFVVEEKCIGCGLCYDACKFNAVLIH